MLNFGVWIKGRLGMYKKNLKDKAHQAKWQFATRLSMSELQLRTSIYFKRQILLYHFLIMLNQVVVKKDVGMQNHESPFRMPFFKASLH